MPAPDAPPAALDGRALAEPLTGIGRYVLETLERMPGSWTALAKPGVPLAASPAAVREIGSPSKDVVWNERALAPAAAEFPVLWGAFGLSPWRRIRGTRLVVTVYDTLEREDVGMARGLAATRRAGHAATARRADVVVAISEATADAFARWYGRRPEVIAAPGPSIGAATDQARDAVLERLADAAPIGTRWLLSVGAPLARKNVARAVAGALEVDGVRIVLVGGTGDAEQEAALAPYAADGRLLRWGRADDDELAALHASTDLLLYAPLAEGFGIPLLDARVSGQRIVTTDAEPMRSAAGAAATLCDARDAGSIAAAVRRALDEPAPAPEVPPGWDDTARLTAAALQG